MNLLYNALESSILNQIPEYETVGEVWEKLINLYDKSKPIRGPIIKSNRQEIPKVLIAEEKQIPIGNDDLSKKDIQTFRESWNYLRGVLTREELIK